MDKNRESLFDKEYFQGMGLYNEVYNWDNTKFRFEMISRAACEAFHPKAALDIGCAKGYLVYMLDSLGVDAYGVDISPYAISEAPKNIKNKLHILDIEEESLPFSDNSFDLIIMLEILEHLSSFNHLTGEIARVLKKGGYVLVTTPNPQGKYAGADKTHINVQSRKFWIKLFNGIRLVLSNYEIWRFFKVMLVAGLKKIIAKSFSLNRISKKGGIFRGIRKNIISYIEYLSPWRSEEVLLFKKL